MVFGAETSPAVAFQKDAFDLTVEEVYNISYVIGRDLRKISGLERSGEEVSDLQSRIVRVLEMFETLVNKYNLSLEELRMERDNLKAELQKALSEGGSRDGTVNAQRALELLQQYRLRLTQRPQSPGGEDDQQLQRSLERVISVFQSQLFNALLGKTTPD
uniref:RILP-like protein 2 n=1 Tax=Knipowitschia caucasica TaxID=637954 RepID=A0AAV2JI57_KNICA